MSGWQGSTRKATLPPDWYTRIRPAVLMRDPWCTCAGEAEGCTRHPATPCGRASTDADHMGDRDDHRLESLAGKCSECHDRKSSRQGAAARWAHRAERPAEQPPGIL